MRRVLVLNVQFADLNGRNVDRVASVALAFRSVKSGQSKRLVVYEAYPRGLKTGWIQSVICMK